MFFSWVDSNSSLFDDLFASKSSFWHTFLGRLFGLYFAPKNFCGQICQQFGVKLSTFSRHFWAYILCRLRLRFVCSSRVAHCLLPYSPRDPLTRDGSRNRQKVDKNNYQLVYGSNYGAKYPSATDWSHIKLYSLRYNWIYMCFYCPINVFYIGSVSVDPH